MKKGAIFFIQLLLTVCAVLVVTTTKAQPHAAFSADTVKGCAPLLVYFTDQSTGNPGSWLWDLGNGNSSTQQNPAATYFNPGTYTITLTARNNAGSDVIIKTSYITVYAKPVVDFSASQTSGCFPLPVKFTNKTDPGNSTIVSWLWDFGDGETDSVKSPSHVYGATGSYHVSLQVQNSNGCSNAITRPSYIQSGSGALAAFSLSAPDNCRPPASVSFVNQSTGTGILSYQWDFGDGQTSTAAHPTHSYTAAGAYTVTLVVTNSDGCTNTLIKPRAIILGTVTAGFSMPNPACAGEAIAFTNTSVPAPAAAQWDFGDGTGSAQISPVKTFAAGGVYPVTLVSDFGACKDSVTIPLTVLQGPGSDFSATNNQGCKTPLTVSFTSTTVNAASYKWLSGDGQTATGPNPVFTYRQPGSYDVTLITTGSTGCSDTLVKKSFVNIGRPQVLFTNTPQEGCVPYTFQPAVSVLTGDVISSYRWDFGDGQTATGPNPVNIYTVAGTYTVKLVYTTAGGCTDSTTVAAAVRVGNVPNPVFDANPRISCAFGAIQFSDKTSGGVDAWLWQFGDSSSSTAPNPSHHYNDTGYFNVTLWVWSNGCKNQATILHFIYVKPPIAIFTDSLSCTDPFTRWFTDKSIGAVSWSWDFGDGQVSTAQHPSHTYALPGTYTVQLTVRNDNCEHSTQRTVTVLREKAGFEADNPVACHSTAITFTGQGYNTQNILTCNWNFGDGIGFYSGNTVTHAYQQAGKYNAQLIITDLNGCNDTLLQAQYIEAFGPRAGFNVSVPAVCALAPLAFTDASVSDGTHPLVKWTWEYGDGRSDTLSAAPFTHSYSNAGLYTVRLTITDSKGCTDTLTKPGTVFISKPTPLFSTPDTLSCMNKPIRFVNSTVANTPASYAWRFGDGQASAAAAPTQFYTSEGKFDITLTATDRYGCIDSIHKTQYIGIFNPQPAFNMSDSMATCPPLVVNFSNVSAHTTGIVWDFGDGTRSASNNPLHFYTFPGTYRAQLTATSPGGCVDSAFRVINIRGPEGHFTYDNKQGCSPDTVHFAGTTTSKASFTWDFGDGIVAANGDSISTHTYTRIGNYLPKMILTDPGGCRVPFPGPDTIQVYGVNARFGSNQQVLCDSGLVRFTDSSQANEPITGFRWNFGDGGGSTVQHPSHFYTSNGHYPVGLAVTTMRGCADSAQLPVAIKIVQAPVVDIAGDTGKCAPALLRLNGIVVQPDTSALQWKWDFGNGNGSVLQNTTVTYTSAGSYPVRLISTNSTGCADTVYKTVESYPIPVVKASADTVICLHNSTTLQAAGAVQYSWQPAASLACTSCATTPATPLSSITYYLVGQTQYGCFNNDSIRITVKQPFRLQADGGDTLCMGESLQLTARGAELYQWTPPAGLSNPQVNNPVAQPTAPQLYQVVGHDDHNCFFDTAWVPVMVYPFPSVNTGPDIQLQVGSSVTLLPALSADVTAINWQPATGLSCTGCATPVAAPKQTTTYTATVVNQGGCVGRDQVTIFVFCNNANLFLPNLFSPNSDGSNDYFYPRGRGLFSIKTLRIFNRWGEVVFERLGFGPNAERMGWDGRHRGKPAPPGVYIYTIDVVCENGAQMTYGGNVMLLR